MADWVDIQDSAVDPDAPVTSELAYAFRDNPIALAEGAAGAPRIQFGAMGSWLTTNGGVGTYVFALCSPVSQGFGDVVSGSQLQPTSAARSVAVSSDGGVANLSLGASLSGTWRCMGVSSSSATAEVSLVGATLWVRVA